MQNRKIFIWNIIFFAVIVIVIIYHYYTHYLNLKKEVFSLVKNEAESIARRFEIAATKLYRSNNFIISIIKDNLKSQAKFIDLLNSIEPFNYEELKEFSKETNLALIYIVPFKKGKKIIGYSNIPLNKFFHKVYNTYSGKLIFDKENNLIIYIYKGTYSNSLIITGITAKKYYQAQKVFTIQNLIKAIVSHRKEVIDIKIFNGKVKELKIILKSEKYFVVTLPFKGSKGKIIQITIDATHGVKIIKNFKHNLAVFLLVIIIIATLVSFLLYYLQKRYITSLQAYERKLYTQEKYASLGRSAALIAHEIRNPINVVSMGLQRIKYETDICNQEEYLNLINTMSNELSRINKTIELFLDYSKPLKVKLEKINLKNILVEILSFFKDNKVKIEINIPDNYFINADKNLIKQVFTNLIKNAYENNNTTLLKIDVIDNQIIFKNNGVASNISCEKIFEPYYTTKTKGAGLGLAIVKKIVESHNWELTCKIEKGEIEFKILQQI